MHISVCVFVPDLYKEYRSLKQAKENSLNDEQPRSTPEVNTAHKVLRESVSVTVNVVNHTSVTISLILLSACC